jgi:hypothetical protein
MLGTGREDTLHKPIANQRQRLGIFNDNKPIFQTFPRYLQMLGTQ